MIKGIVIALLTIAGSSRCASHDTAVVPSPTADEPVLTAAQPPAILEAEVEGVGKAIITDRTILVKLPAGYTKSTVRITYKVTAGVKKITPASGQDIPVRSEQAPTVCIQNDASGNCTVAYQLIIQTGSALRVALDPASRELEVTRYLQPYGLTFQLGNLNAQAGVTRRFQVRFVHKSSGYTYVGDNYMVNDRTGSVVFVNQPNVAVPDEGQLRMTGTLPADMPTGDYAVSVLVPTCYSPTADGRCLSAGTEGVDLPEPFVLLAGPPLVGETNLTPTAANELVIKGRNLSVTKPIAIKLANDFTAPVSAGATVESETLARLVLPAALPVGQYRLDASPVGGQPYSVLFTVPGATPKPAFAYVAPVGSYVATQNALPALPVFKGGDVLEVRYSTGVAQPVKALRLVAANDSTRTIDLTGNTSFRPYAGVTEFIMWKWTLPANVPRGMYALVFETSGGTLSLPYYQTIRVD